MANPGEVLKKHPMFITKQINKEMKNETLREDGRVYNMDNLKSSPEEDLEKGRMLNKFDQSKKPSGIKKAITSGKLGAVGAASSVMDTASEIDKIRKGKSDILERTGIVKKPQEL